MLQCPGSINGCECVRDEAHRCAVLLVQQRGHMLVDMYNLEFKHFQTIPFYDGSEGDHRLKYVLEQNCVVDKCPDGDTLVPKHVGLGT